MKFHRRLGLLLLVGLAQLQSQVSTVLDQPDTREKLAGVGCKPFQTTPEQFATIIRNDLPHWAKVVKDSGATID